MIRGENPESLETVQQSMYRAWLKRQVIFGQYPKNAMEHKEFGRLYKATRSKEVKPIAKPTITIASTNDLYNYDPLVHGKAYSELVADSEPILYGNTQRMVCLKALNSYVLAFKLHRNTFERVERDRSEALAALDLDPANRQSDYMYHVSIARSRDKPAISECVQVLNDYIHENQEFHSAPILFGRLSLKVQPRLEQPIE